MVDLPYLGEEPPHYVAFASKFSTLNHFTPNMTLAINAGAKFIGSKDEKVAKDEYRIGFEISKPWNIARYGNGRSVNLRPSGGFFTAQGGTHLSQYFTLAAEMCKDRPNAEKGCFGFQTGHTTHQHASMLSTTALYAVYEVRDGTFSKIAISPPINTAGLKRPPLLTFQFGKSF